MRNFYSPARTLLLAGLGAAGAARAQAPVLTARQPAANAVAAPRTAAVQLTFSQPLRAAAAQPDAVRVASNWRGTLAGTYAGAGTAALSFQPAQALLPGESVRVSVLARAASPSGVAAVPADYRFLAAAAPGPGLFPNPQEVPVQTSPLSLMAGDVNGDGHSDIITANRGSGTVSVRLGDGRGGFTNRPEVAIPAFPNQLAVGDFNNDGKPDFVTVHSNIDSGIFVFLGDGQGGFSRSNFDTTVSRPESVAVGELNGDGNLDLVVASGFPAFVAVRLGNGRGGFADPSPLSNVTLAQTPNNVALADVNRDGALDFLTTNFFNNSVSVRLGTGTGSFRSGADVPVGNRPGRVTVADVNEDGNPDLLCNLRTGTALGLVSVRLGAGNGQFSASLPDVPAGDTPGRAVARDLNADGHLDLAIPNLASSTVSVRLGNGQGRFAGTTEVAVGDYPGDAALADVDSDGDLDLLTANFGTFNAEGTTVSVRRGDGRGGFASPLNVPTGTGPVQVAVGDLNGDRVLDFVAANEAGGSVSVRLGTGGGAFRALPDLPVAASPREVVLGDVNNDGRLDLLTAHLSSATVGVRLGNGLGGFAAQAVAVDMRGAPNALALADCNHDGWLDLFGSNYSLDEVAVRLGNGTGNFTGSTNLALGRSAGPYGVVADDVNEDGHLDLLIVNSGLDNSTLSVRLGDGQGNFTGTTNVPTGRGPSSLDVGDFNHDGHLDVVTGNFGGNAVGVRLGDGQGGFGGTTSIALGGITPSNVRLGDVNGDGHLDLVTANLQGRQVQVRHGDGQGSFREASLQTLPVGLDPDGLALADVDADGDLDILVACEAANYVAVRLNGSASGPLLAAYPTPTPFDGQLTVDLSGFGQSGVELSLWTALGQQLASYRVARPSASTKLRLPAALPAGVYLLRARADDGRVASGRLVRE